MDPTKLISEFEYKLELWNDEVEASINSKVSPQELINVHRYRYGIAMGFLNCIELHRPQVPESDLFSCRTKLLETLSINRIKVIKYNLSNLQDI